MKTKPKKTPEEIAEHEHQKKLRRRFRSLRTKVVNQCKAEGLHNCECQLEYLKGNPGAKLPMVDLDHEATVDAYVEGIKLYKEELRGTN